MRKQIKSFFSRVRFSTIRSLRSNIDTSVGYLGRTFAIGLSAGIFFFFGQMAIVLALWLILDRILKFRFSLITAILLTFISNPLTTPFMIYTFYMTGSAMLGSAAVSFTELTQQFSSIANKQDLWEGLGIIFYGVGRPIILGSIPWHIVIAFVGYWIGIKSHRQFQETVKHRDTKKQIKKLRLN